MDDAAAAAARRAAMATIEKESHDKTGLRSDVVTLYQGGQYHLYRFKKYTDVRLVFAPEFDIAFFGGDPDNFEYPRYDLDVCFFRVYEDGKPARPEHYLKWSPAGRRTATWSSSPATPAAPAGSTRWRTSNTCATSPSRSRSSCSTTARRSCSTTASRAPEQARQSKEDLFSYPELAQGARRAA